MQLRLIILFLVIISLTTIIHYDCHVDNAHLSQIPSFTIASVSLENEITDMTPSENATSINEIQEILPTHQEVKKFSVIIVTHNEKLLDKTYNSV